MTIEVMLAAGCTPTEICRLWRLRARQRDAEYAAVREAVLAAERLVLHERLAQQRLRFLAHLAGTGRCSEYGPSAYLRAS